MSVIRRRNNHNEIDLWFLCQLMLKKAWLIILTGILGAALFFGVTYFFIEKEYTASATIYVNNMNGNANVSNITSSDVSASVMLVQTYLSIIESNSIYEEVIEETELDYTVKELANHITVGTVENTEILMIQVTTNHPKESALIANTLETVVEKRLPDIVEGSSVKIVDHATVPTEKSYPSYSKMTLIGGVLGVFFSMIFIFILAIMDKTVKSEKDLEQWKYPILGSIPDMKSSTSRDRYGYYKK